MLQVVAYTILHKILQGNVMKDHHFAFGNYYKKKSLFNEKINIYQIRT